MIGLLCLLFMKFLLCYSFDAYPVACLDQLQVKVGNCTHQWRMAYAAVSALSLSLSLCLSVQWLFQLGALAISDELSY